MTDRERQPFDFDAVLQDAQEKLDAPARVAAGALLGIITPYFADPDSRPEAIRGTTPSGRDWGIVRNYLVDTPTYTVVTRSVLFRVEPEESVDYSKEEKDAKVTKTPIGSQDEGKPIPHLGLSTQDVRFLEDLVPAVREILQERD